jgi:tetratricopeptide (TPR) repeat protein
VGYVSEAANALNGSLDDFRKATGVKAADVYMYVYRGLARRQSGDPEGAIADYSMVLGLRQRNPKALVGRGNAYFDLERFRRPTTTTAPPAKSVPTTGRSISTVA